MWRYPTVDDPALHSVRSGILSLSSQSGTRKLRAWKLMGLFGDRGGGGGSARETRFGALRYLPLAVQWYAASMEGET
jgi:hypothetical protein